MPVVDQSSIPQASGSLWSYAAVGVPVCPLCHHETQRAVVRKSPAIPHEHFGLVYAWLYQCRGCGEVYVGYHPAPVPVLDSSVFEKHFGPA